MDDRDEFGVYHRFEITTRDDGSAQVRTETNDDNDDGFPDGQVESWLLEFRSLDEALRHTGTSRRGYYGQPVDVFLNGKRLSAAATG